MSTLQMRIWEVKRKDHCFEFIIVHNKVYEKVCRGGDNLEIVTIQQEGGVFSLEEVNIVLPLIKSVTNPYVQKVETLMSQLEQMDHNHNSQVIKLESAVNALIREWHVKVKKLGGVPKGLWYVDFDAGDGYFSWLYPENKIDFWHRYSEGITQRLPLAGHAKYSGILENKFK